MCRTEAESAPPSRQHATGQGSAQRPQTTRDLGPRQPMAIVRGQIRPVPKTRHRAANRPVHQASVPVNLQGQHLPASAVTDKRDGATHAEAKLTDNGRISWNQEART